MSDNNNQQNEVLSPNDEAILKTIFNSAEPLNIPSTCFETNKLPELKDLELDNEENGTDLKKIEIKGIKQAENGELIEAIKTLTEAINLAPSIPSPYNNRAQVYRLMENDEAAFDDIQKVIELTKQSKGDIYCKALCQRAILYFKRRQDSEAMRDFQEAASLGNQFAREQVVKLNPYARMCNATLKKVFESLK